VDAHHTLQVSLGKLAQEKGRDDAVKRFGERMERDHGALQEQLNNMASRNGMPYKSGMGPENRANLDRLEKMSGRAFDRAYMTFMIQSHNGYLNYWRNEGRAARSAPVRTLVNRGLPTLEEHMEMARRVGTNVGVNPNAALAGRRIADR
jgi:putative membrane protein